MVVALLCTVAIVIVDQILKFLVTTSLSSGDCIHAIPGLLDIVYTENSGAAFGFMQNQQILFIIMTVLVIAFIVVFTIKKKLTNKLYLSSVSLIVGGSVGNFIDRITKGYVVDYLKVSFFPPVCNLADYCITVGAVLLVIYILCFSEVSKKNNED